jgi:hypothetical protein
MQIPPQLAGALDPCLRRAFAEIMRWGRIFT